jgi:hypothetical protein
MTTLAERLESLKSGTVGSIQLMQGIFNGGGSASYGLDFGFGVDVAIAALSGFLFGVTCRYAIRQDDNPHLSSGVVLAFGLVRGLAQVNGQDLSPSILPLVAFAILESILLFAVAYAGLSMAMRIGWVKHCL